LNELAERALAALEEREEPPTVTEVNGARRLIARCEQERELERLRTLTTDAGGHGRTSA
jgi:hypothetical protein